MSRRDRRKKRRRKPGEIPEVPGLRPWEVTHLAERVVDLMHQGQEYEGGTPQFKVGDRVRIKVQTDKVGIRDVVIPDPEVGALGTIEEDHLYPVYGVRVDPPHGATLSGYHDNELELAEERIISD